MPLSEKCCVIMCVRERFSNTSMDAATGLLPPDRTAKAGPFEVINMDFAGPLYVKKRAVQAKAYIVLFTCAVTRAIHLELVPDTTTEFLAGFQSVCSAWSVM